MNAMDSPTPPLSYAEWFLGASSRQPGWVLVSRFFSAILSEGVRFVGAVYSRDKRTGEYREWRSAEGEPFPTSGEAFETVMYRSAISFLVVPSDLKALHELLSNYDLVSEGPLHSWKAVLRVVDSLPYLGWENLTKDSVLLVIHHDGDPIFVLTKEQEAAENPDPDS